MKVVNETLVVALLDIIRSEAELTVKLMDIDKEHGVRSFSPFDYSRASNFLKSVEMKIDVIKNNAFSAREIA